MRHKVTIPEGSAAHRSFHFRPQDPIWAPAGHLEAVRKRLARHDPYISVWWSPLRRMDTSELAGRWRVVEWMPRNGNWSTAFYWEGPNGEYLEPCAEAIIRKLESIRVPANVAAQEVDATNERVTKKQRAELRAACEEDDREARARLLGIRQTFGPGYIRSRRAIRQGDKGNDTNHKRFVRRWLAEHGGVKR